MTIGRNYVLWIAYEETLVVNKHGFRNKKRWRLRGRTVRYEKRKFIEVYNANIEFTNEEAINASAVATAIIHLMNTQAVWSEMGNSFFSLTHNFLS